MAIVAHIAKKWRFPSPSTGSVWVVTLSSLGCVEKTNQAERKTFTPGGQDVISNSLLKSN